MRGDFGTGSDTPLDSVCLLALVSYTFTGAHKVVQVHCRSVHALATLKHKNQPKADERVRRPGRRVTAAKRGREDR